MNISALLEDPQRRSMTRRIVVNAALLLLAPAWKYQVSLIGQSLSGGMKLRRLAIWIPSQTRCPVEFLVTLETVSTTAFCQCSCVRMR